MTITPPIQWLPAFEAASRLNSFKLAAEELHMTPSAMSQVIKRLEDHIDIKLFHRYARRIELTDAGSNFHKIAKQVLERYRNEYKSFYHQHKRPLLRISMAPFMASDIVIPNLRQFQAQHPELELQIETSHTLVDFQQESVDAAIRFGEGNWEGTTSYLLEESEACLVCSRDFLEKNPISGYSDIFKHTLIHDSNDSESWITAAKLLGVPHLIDGHRKLVFDNYLAAINAAEQGLGISIALFPLTKKRLDDGRLVDILSKKFKIPQNLFFVTPKDQTKNHYLQLFFEWLKGLSPA